LQQTSNNNTVLPKEAANPNNTVSPRGISNPNNTVSPRGAANPNLGNYTIRPKQQQAENGKGNSDSTPSNSTKSVSATKISSASKVSSPPSKVKTIPKVVKKK
jgi:hypothetical protein